MAELAQRAEPAPRTPVTPRAVVLGLALAAVNTWWVVMAEARWGIMDGSCLPLFVTPVFILAALAAINLGLRRIHSRLALSPVELLTAYIVVVISETLSGHDFVQNLFGTIGHAHWFASPENRWEELFHEYLPPWLVVSDLWALEHLYEGGGSFLRADLCGPFLIPLLAWAAILLALIGAMLCINILVQRHWTEHEKLAYPMVVLPLEMVSGDPPAAGFFADVMIWLGFSGGAGVTLVNGLSAILPQVPPLPLIKLTRPTFTSFPWRGLYRFYYGVYPFAVALAFFIPADLSFSCWFFFLVSQVQMVGAELLGMREAPPNGFPYLAHQSAGAWLALAIGALLTTRAHLARTWRLIWRSAEHGQEARLYRWAAAGLVGCLAALGIMLGLAGMGLWLILGFIAIFYLLSMAMTRVRAEFGTPHEIYYINPQRIIVNTTGVPALGARQLTALSVVYWFNRCYRCHPMPFQLESLKMAREERIDLGSLARTVVLATVAGIALSYWANLHIAMREGAAAKCVAFKSWVGRESYLMLANWLHSAPGPDYPAIGATAAGAAIFWSLRWVHFRTSLPLHPAGYALATSFAMNYFWSSFLLGWLVKVAVLRYGGRTGHQRAFRVFLGVLLGDYVMGSIWGIIGPVWGIQTYKNFI
ncbi:MAG: DUF6785 family protein [Armatimonadota bacterium]